MAAHAQSFPTRPVRIPVPCAAGGAVDVLVRTLGQSLSKTWGQLPVIENRPGAALKDPVVLTALEKMGATPAGSSPADFDAFMRAEAKKWEPVVRRLTSRCRKATGHPLAYRAFAGACRCHRSARQCSTTASIRARPATA